MALASRILSRSRQIYASQAVFQLDCTNPVRFYAKDASSTNGSLKGDEMLKEIFFDVKKKYDTALGIFKKEKITIDPDDPAAVAHYANVWKTVREKAGLHSESDKIKNTIELQTDAIPDVRTFLLTTQQIRIKAGLIDDLGAGAMMMEALDKVENEIKKPLVRSDKKSMSLFTAEIDKIYKKLGINEEDLPKYEEEAELDMAKADLTEMKKNAIETMETLLKREEFKDEEMVDVKTLDIRNFL